MNNSINAPILNEQILRAQMKLASINEDLLKLKSTKSDTIFTEMCLTKINDDLAQILKFLNP